MPTHRLAFLFCCLLTLICAFSRAADLPADDAKHAGELIAQMGSHEAVKRFAARADLLRLALKDPQKLDAWEAYFDEKRRDPQIMAPLPMQLKTHAEVAGEYVTPNVDFEAKTILGLDGTGKIAVWDAKTKVWEERISGQYAVDRDGRIMLDGIGLGFCKHPSSEKEKKKTAAWKKDVDDDSDLHWMEAFHFVNGQLVADYDKKPLAKIDPAKLSKEQREAAVVKPKADDMPQVVSSVIVPRSEEDDFPCVITISNSYNGQTDTTDTTYIWKQIDGPKIDLDADALSQPTIRMPDLKPGHYKFRAVVKLKDKTSFPQIVDFIVPALEKPSKTAPVTAVASAVPPLSPTAVKGNADGPHIVLDGSASTGPDKAALKYEWKQVRGDDLKIPAEDLKKEKLTLRCEEPGSYRFELTVSDGNKVSAPVRVDAQFFDNKWLAEPHFEDTAYCVYGQCNGQWIKLILDSGAGSTCLFRPTADRLKFPVWEMSYAPFHPLGRRIKTSYVMSFDIAYLDMSQTFSQGAINFPKSMSADEDGLLSWTELSERVYEIDVANERWKLHEKLPADMKGYTKRKLLPDKNMLKFEVKEGDETWIIAIDTGAYHGVVLNRRHWPAWRAAHSARAGTVECGFFPAAGADGLTIQEVFRARNYTVGDMVFPDMSVARYTDFHTQGHNDAAMVLGIYAISRFNLILDPKNKAIYTRPVKATEWPASRYHYNRLGAAFYPQDLERNSDIVAHVVKDSPAYDAGLRGGDVLVQIAGTDVPKWKYTDPFPRYNGYCHAPSGTPLKFSVMRNGKKLDFQATLREPQPNE